MAKRILRRRGTTVQHSTFTGGAGELTVDTTKNTVVVHNGTLAGGFPLAKISDLPIGITPVAVGFTATAGTTSRTLTVDVALTASAVATLASVQSLTNKTITDIVFALTGTTPAFTATNGAVQTWALTAASSPTDALTTGQSIILVITPGSFALTWPAGTVFTKVGGSGAAPTLFSAGKSTVILWKVGAVLYASHLGDTV